MARGLESRGHVLSVWWKTIVQLICVFGFKLHTLNRIFHDAILIQRCSFLWNELSRIFLRQSFPPAWITLVVHPSFVLPFVLLRTISMTENRLSQTYTVQSKKNGMESPEITQSILRIRGNLAEIHLKQENKRSLIHLRKIIHKSWYTNNQNHHVRTVSSNLQGWEGGGVDVKMFSSFANIGCNGRYITWSLTNVTKAS